MNILDFLIQDHGKMRRELVLIHRAIDHADLRQKLRKFISSYEMHEAIEEEILFPAFEETLRKRHAKRVAPGHAHAHQSMWGHMDRLMSQVNQVHQKGLRQAFFEFSALVEQHFEEEERNVFPFMRKALEERRLQELGTQALRKLQRFEPIAVGA